MRFEQAYLVALAERYGSGVRLVDFKASPQAARNVINAWVKARTVGRIPHLLGAQGRNGGPRDSSWPTRCTSRRRWAIPFQPSETQARGVPPPANGSTLTVATMDDTLDSRGAWPTRKRDRLARR